MLLNIHGYQISVRFALPKAIFELGQFETSALNDIKMPLNTVRSNVSHICATSAPEWQNSLTFALRSADVKLQVILRSILNDTKMMNSTRTKAPHVCITDIPESQISFHFNLQPALFELRFFEASAPNDPKMPLNPTRSNVPYIHY